MATIAGVEIHVETESPAYMVNIMTHPVEEGLAITDHVQQMPIGLSLTGQILNPNASEKRDRLRVAMNSGELVVYLGRNSAYTMLISSMHCDHTHRIANGFSFTMELIETRIVRVLQEASLDTDPTLTATAEEGNLGTQQLEQTGEEVYATIQDGDTFWGLSGVFRTTVSSIQDLNPGVNPLTLQIGQKVRVT
jgi:hypothetical protein